MGEMIEVIHPPPLRLLGMSWGVETTCLEAPGVSLGGSGVSIGGVRILRGQLKLPNGCEKQNHKIKKKRMRHETKPSYFP